MGWLKSTDDKFKNFSIGNLHLTAKKMIYIAVKHGEQTVTGSKIIADFFAYHFESIYSPIHTSLHFATTDCLSISHTFPVIHSA